jgi:hypothetical protein
MNTCVVYIQSSWTNIGSNGTNILAQRAHGAQVPKNLILSIMWYAKNMSLHTKRALQTTELTQLFTMKQGGKTLR